MFQMKRADVAEIILSLAKEDTSIVSEYLTHKKINSEEARNNPNEFDAFGSEELEEFLQNELNMKLDELDAKTRDRAVIMYYTQLQEQRLLLRRESYPSSEKK